MGGERTSEGHVSTGQEPNAKSKPDLGSFDEQTLELVLDRLCDGLDLSRPVHKTLDAVIETVKASIDGAAAKHHSSAPASPPAVAQHMIHDRRREGAQSSEIVGVRGPAVAAQPWSAPTSEKGPDLSDVPNSTVGMALAAMAEAWAAADAPAAVEIGHVCIQLATFLIEKNSRYGNSALEPLRILSRADPVEQIRVRMDDKLSRLMRGEGAGPDASEDAIKDLVGYWVLLQVANGMHAKPGKNGSE